MIAQSLIDTDILSALMRQNPNVVTQSRRYLAVHQRLTISIITRYEVIRGLMVKNADRQLSAFEQFCSTSQILLLSDDVIIKAADIYATLYNRGELINDADILIAATAMVHNLVLVTNNERHFQRIDGLQIENWLK